MNPKIIVTLGPATKTEDYLRQIKDRGAAFARVNMSHSEISDLEYFIGLAKKVGLPFIIDTEGSQVRSGKLKNAPIHFEENKLVKIHAQEILGDDGNICLKPNFIVSQLEKDDLVQIDFDNLVLRVEDASMFSAGYISARVVSSGWVGSNKAAVITPAVYKTFYLPPLSEKDYQAIELGLKENIGHIAVSFVRRPEDLDEVRRATKNSMKIISKIECVDALNNLEPIIKKSDFLLIDRGDLSNEIPIEKIPLAQKFILSKAKKHGVGVFVATNLLETMVEKRRPTRAEANDVVNTILDGASGLALAAETAIGKHPVECIDMMQKLIRQASVMARKPIDVFNIEELFYDQARKKGAVLWFTGLSGSGKTTIANVLAGLLQARGKSVKILDGDDIRSAEHKHLGFSRGDIRENNFRIANLAKQIQSEFDFVLVPIISPCREDRQKAKEIIGENFADIFINAPLSECAKRDAKGLYQKAQRGEIADLIGFNGVGYEAPLSPDIEIKNDNFKIEDGANVILNYLIK